jgi:hypothetical protein
LQAHPIVRGVAAFRPMPRGYGFDAWDLSVFFSDLV